MTMTAYVSRETLDAGASQERISNDVAVLDRRFQPWWQRLSYWQEWAFPGNPIARVMTELGSVYQKATVEAIEQVRSKYISEWIGTRGDTLTWLRSSAPDVVQPAIYGKDAATRAAQEGLIHWATGQLTALDHQKARGQGGFSWKYQMKLLSTWTGKTAFKTQVRKGPDGYLYTTAPFIDPLSLMHDIDVEPEQQNRLVTYERLPWSDIERSLSSLVQGRAVLPILRTQKSKDEKNELALVANYWRSWVDDDNKQHLDHSYLVEGDPTSSGQKTWQPVRAEVEWRDHGYACRPVTVVSRPSATHSFQDFKLSGVNSQEMDAKTYYHAEPFYARAINELIFLQGLKSLRADDAALAATLIFLSRGDDAQEKGERDIKPPLTWLKMLPQEQLSILEHVGNGRISLDSAIEECMQNLNTVYPDHLVVYQGGSNEAGYAINSKIKQSANYLVPWTLLDEMATGELLRNIIDQHVHIHPTGKFKLSGMLSRSKQTFGMLWGVGDYPKGEFDVNVRSPAEIPGEAQQEAALAKQRLELGLSSVWQERVNAGDPTPDATQEQIDEQNYRQSPEWLNRDKLRRMRAEVQALEEAWQAMPPGKARTNARLDAAVAQDDLAKLELQLGGAPKTGQTDPSQPTNPPNTALPPQMTPDDPNMAALAANVPPTGTQGRPS